MDRLVISPDGRRLQSRSGEPFFYLADTAWTLPQRLKWDDVRHYMSVRKSQGFTALQIVALDPERDIHMRSPAGEPALIDDDLDRPNERYFEYLDLVLDLAVEYGFYVLLLPAWGQLVVGESWGGGTYPKTVTSENARRFGHWLGARYRDRTNIIWSLGGDRHPIHAGIDYRDVWRQMAEGLAEGILGEQLRWNEPSPAWAELLITYHTCFEMETGEFSSMSYWTDEEAWLSFVVLQSGHGLTTRSYVALEVEHAREPARPFIDIEPAYERMPMNWPKLFPLHGDWIVRKRAYWAVLAGACGHTYGHASVWCMISEKERNEVLDATWFEALTHPGASQMASVRTLATILPFTRWIPDQALTAHATECGTDCLDSHRQSARDVQGEFIIAYLTDGGWEEIDTSSLNSDEIHGAWFDPRHGDVHTRWSESRAAPQNPLVLSAPTAGEGQDWVLVLSTSPALIDALAGPHDWGSPDQAERMSMIWAE